MPETPANNGTNAFSKKAFGFHLCRASYLLILGKKRLLNWLWSWERTGSILRW
jgi:hypothetical protein